MFTGCLLKPKAEDDPVAGCQGVEQRSEFGQHGRAGKSGPAARQPVALKDICGFLFPTVTTGCKKKESTSKEIFCTSELLDLSYFTRLNPGAGFNP